MTKGLSKPMAEQQLRNRLKAFRSERGMTQADLAAKIGVTRKTINTVENQVFVPSTVLALKLADVFNVTVNDLFYLDKANSKTNT